MLSAGNPIDASDSSEKLPSDQLEAILRNHDLKLAKGSDEGPLIMMVEDEVPVLMLGEIILKEKGYRMIPVLNPLIGLAVFKEIHSALDAVLIDFKMPQMTGGELFKRMRRINPGIPTMLVSGYAERDDIEQMLANGLNAYLPKPFTSSVLVNAVERLLE